MKIKGYPNITKDPGSPRRKREKAVDRILIMAAKSGPDRMLIASVRALFPDCEINVICRASGAGEQSLSPYERDVSLQEQGGHDGNHSRSG